MNKMPEIIELMLKAGTEQRSTTLTPDQIFQLTEYISHLEDTISAKVPDFSKSSISAKVPDFSKSSISAKVPDFSTCVSYQNQTGSNNTAVGHEARFATVGSLSDPIKPGPTDDQLAITKKFFRTYSEAMEYVEQIDENNTHLSNAYVRNFAPMVNIAYYAAILDLSNEKEILRLSDYLDDLCSILSIVAAHLDGFYSAE